MSNLDQQSHNLEQFNSSAIVQVDPLVEGSEGLLLHLVIVECLLALSFGLNSYSPFL